MLVKIHVWADFDKDSKTPLLVCETFCVGTYGEASEKVSSMLQAHNGKRAHGMCDGPNQNYNSIWK